MAHSSVLVKFWLFDDVATSWTQMRIMVSIVAGVCRVLMKRTLASVSIQSALSSQDHTGQQTYWNETIMNVYLVGIMVGNTRNKLNERGGKLSIMSANIPIIWARAS